MREAWATALAQPVASTVSILIIMGMCACVLLTTGKAVGAEDRVLKSIDNASTRAVVVRAQVDSGLDTEVLNRLGNVVGIQWVAAFSAASDVQNASFPGGIKVPTRTVWGTDLGALGFPSHVPLEDSAAYASDTALRQLGIHDAGGIRGQDGATYAIMGRLPIPRYLDFLQPAVFVPNTAPASSTPKPVAILVVLASTIQDVAAVAAATQSVLDISDPTKATVSTSADLATLRGQVEGQLGSFGNALIALVFGVSAGLVAVMLYGLVMLRRRDFGRRRALGATRGLIVGMLLVQISGLSLIGAVVGSLGSALALLAMGSPLPDFGFFVAVDVLSVAIATAAALAPAVFAARRDPLHELRVP